MDDVRRVQCFQRSKSLGPVGKLICGVRFIDGRPT